MSELSDLIRFFHLCRGRAHQFRYKNWLDYKSCDVEDNITPYDQVFGVGDGVESEFQLIKRYELYGISSLTLEYIIKKPVPNTVIVAINNNIKTINVDYVVDTTTGIVTFTTIPSVGDVLTWGGEFDLPCRFDVDELQISLDFFEHGSTNIPLIEVRLE